MIHVREELEPGSLGSHGDAVEDSAPVACQLLSPGGGAGGAEAGSVLPHLSQAQLFPARLQREGTPSPSLESSS